MSLLIHAGIVLVLLLVASKFNLNSPYTYAIAFLYLYQIDRHYTRRICMRIRHEEMKHANQKRLLSDSETVRWLNHCMEKIWPICLEKLASQEILMPIIPWFLEKYKPWTARKATIQQLYLGRNPPVFTEMRALSHSSDDDHLVLDLGLSFLSAEDMSAVLSVQMRKRLGFGMWANLHVTGMHLEGKVRVGVRFLREKPFVQRIRLCFEEVPYFQMTVKPIFSHGLDVAELPGIAGWLDKILTYHWTYAFEQSLVKPNMHVIDVEQLLGLSQSSESDSKSLDGKLPIAYVKLEILEGTDMKPSDPNGLADPFVKGCLEAYQFKTKIQKKTLTPKWQEEFKIPIFSWDSPNQLVLNVRDKDTFRDDELGVCTINVSNLRGGQRHDKWISLEKVKMGRLHVAITVVDVDTGSKKMEVEQLIDDQSSMQHEDVNRSTSYSSTHSQRKENAPMEDEIEAINPQGSNNSPIWIHHPGSDVSKTWSLRKNKSGKNNTIKSEEGHGKQDGPMSLQSQTSLNEPEESSNEEDEENDNTSKGHKMKKLRNKLHRFHTKFQKDKGNDKLSEPSDEKQREEHSEKLVVRSNKETGIKLVFDNVPENLTGHFVDMNYDTKNVHPSAKENCEDQKTDVEGHGKGNVKDKAKNILKQATKSVHGMTNVLIKMNHSNDNNEGANGHSSFMESPSKDHNSDKSSLCDSDSAEYKQECKLPLSEVPQNDMKLERDDISTSPNRSQKNMSIKEDNNNSTASSSQ